MNDNIKDFLEEFDKELLENYKNIKMTDIPDLWNSIERNLAPKSGTEESIKQTLHIREKNRHSGTRRFAVLAAVLLAVLLLIPTVNYISREQVKNSTSGSSMDMASEQTAASVDGIDQNKADSNQEAGTSGSSQDGSTASDEESVQTDQADTRKIKVEVLSVQEEEETAKIRIIEGSGQNLQTGDSLTLAYDGTELETSRLQGILWVMVETTEKNIKILEILP